MITLAFPAPRLTALHDELSASPVESAAILLCSTNRWDDEWRLNVIEVHVAQEADYLERSSDGLRLDPRFCLPIERRARDKGLSLVYVHTHPTEGHARFSKTDDATERQLADYLTKRCPDVPHLALLFPKGSAPLCRKLAENVSVRLVEVGAHIHLWEPEPGGHRPEARFDRQVRAFGSEGQKRLAGLRVGIVGLGGTGSQVAQQLAYLGVGEYLLIDHDTIELTNLNRVVGGLPGDAGVGKKVDVARRMIQSIRPEAVIHSLDADVTVEAVARKLAHMDLVFNCTDNHASRHVVNQLAYQYLVPAIDLGVAITVSDNGTNFGGHVQMLSPTLPCLWCSNHLDARRVREELMTIGQRAIDPYFQGDGGAVQPAVISINGTIASVAVTMMLAAVVGIPSKPRYLAYDGGRGRMNALAVAANPECPFCGADAPIGYGNLVPLPTRREQ